MTTSKKGKAKVVSVVTLEKVAMLEDRLVMSIRKRTIEEEEGRGVAGSRKRKRI